MCACTHTHTHVCAHTHTKKHTSINVHTHTHTHTHACAHAHTHTHTCTYASSRGNSSPLSSEKVWCNTSSMSSSRLTNSCERARKLCMTRSSEKRAGLVFTRRDGGRKPPVCNSNTASCFFLFFFSNRSFCPTHEGLSIPKVVFEDSTRVLNNQLIVCSLASSSVLMHYFANTTYINEVE